MVMLYIKKNGKLFKEKAKKDVENHFNTELKAYIKSIKGTYDDW